MHRESDEDQVTQSHYDSDDSSTWQVRVRHESDEDQADYDSDDSSTWQITAPDPNPEYDSDDPAYDQIHSLPEAESWQDTGYTWRELQLMRQREERVWCEQRERERTGRERIGRMWREEEEEQQRLRDASDCASDDDTPPAAIRPDSIASRVAERRRGA